MLKKRDYILFGIPLFAFILVIALGYFLHWQIVQFEKNYIKETHDNIMQDANLIAKIICPLLNQNKIAEAKIFCDTFDSESLRITLISNDGTVIADSAEDSKILANHLNRIEVQGALKGKNNHVIRYSESLNKYMMYAAIKLKANNNYYILRTAISTNRVFAVIRLLQSNTLWALFLGGILVFIIAFYVIIKIRKPLITLQEEVNSIAKGQLDTHIEIPNNGILRELCMGIMDMTEQLKNQLFAIKEEHHERQVIFDSMHESILLIAHDGSLIDCNKSAIKLFKIKNKNFNLSRCQIPKLYELFLQNKPFEEELILNNNKYLYVKGNIIEKKSCKQLLLTITNLTNLRNLENFRSDFVANVSHEIRTPLTCIIGACEALEANANLYDSKLINMLKINSERLNRLIQDILTLASIEKQDKDTKTFSNVVGLDLILSNVKNLYMEKTAKKNISLQIKKSSPVNLMGDEVLLEQVLINLIENAIKYSNCKKIDLSLYKTEKFVIIEVVDDGIGIDKAHQARIFERFYRVDKSRSREFGGTGLGLAIVKHTILLHGGTIELISQPNEGCCFKITLPLNK